MLSPHYSSTVNVLSANILASASAHVNAPLPLSTAKVLAVWSVLSLSTTRVRGASILTVASVRANAVNVYASIKVLYSKALAYKIPC